MGELEVRHNCGLVVAHSLNDAYVLLNSLQHRGREAAGIAAIANGRIDVIKWAGPVSSFDLFDLQELLPNRRYHTYLGHLRYATQGRKDKILEDAHPQTIGGTIIHKGNHVIILDCEMAAVHNGQINEDYFSGIDKSGLTGTCDTEAILHLMKYGNIDECGFLKKIPGSYTLAFAHKNRPDVVLMRDRLGMMPGVIGKKEGKFVAASENIAFTQNSTDFEKEMKPGTIYYFHPNGELSQKTVFLENSQSLQQCMFQYNYIAHVDTLLNGVSVMRIRQLLGEQLAKEFSPEVDFVTYLPRCPKVAAEAYAEKRDIEFIRAFYKMKNERAFQGPTIEERAQSINSNLFLNDSIVQKIQGKKILLIDDSIVRGNNSRKALELLREAGAGEAIIASYTPKIGIIGDDGLARGCMFGIDMPPESNDFVARQKTDDEINRAIGATTHFLSLEGMLSAFEKTGLSRKDLCYFCVGGKHPFASHILK